MALKSGLLASEDSVAIERDGLSEEVNRYEMENEQLKEVDFEEGCRDESHV